MNSDSPEAAFRLVADSLPHPVLLCGPDGRGGSANLAFARLCPGSDWRQLVHPDDAEALGARWETGIAAGAAFACEARLRPADGAEPWFSIHAAPAGPGRWIVCFTDIDARKGAEAHHLTFLRETSHRVKNLFAMVNGLVSMTARSAGSPKEMADSLRGRVGALSRAYDLVRTAHEDGTIGEGTTLDRLVHATLAPHARPGERAAIAGPAVPVGPATVTNLALVLHELAANAAKYGALSAVGGWLAVEWTIAGDEVSLVWAEQGGPPLPSLPPAEGFGTQLARRTVTGQLGGDMAHEWRPTGLRLSMTLSRERLAR